MDNSTELNLTKQLTLFNSSGLPLALQVVNCDLADVCRLILQVDHQLYQQIESEMVFNLKPHLRGASSVVAFHDNAAIEIEIALQAQLLSQLTQQAIDAETVIAYLISCAEQESARHHLLLFTESWFALNVRQVLELDEIGYRTFWSYLNPKTLTSDASINEPFFEAVKQFLKDQNEANVPRGGEAISEVFEEITNRLKSWNQTESLKQAESAIAEIFTEMTQALGNLTDSISTSSASSSGTSGRIYQAIVNFFSEDDWAFVKQQGESILRLAFKGKNGQWNCYAKAVEQHHQFIFYSICPFRIPESNQVSMMKLLTTLNYNLAIGNFEMDLNEGSIYFRTSVDVMGCRLSSALIKPLVYTNVLTIDRYLPSIRAVLDGATLADALCLIEPPEPSN